MNLLKMGAYVLLKYFRFSSGYKDNSAYWIGASDKNFEGDFAWSNGFPFTYSSEYID